VRPALILGRADVAELLPMDDCIQAVERALVAHAEGRTLPPAIVSVPAGDGGFHVKAAGVEFDRRYFAAKVNGNFSTNPARHGLPAIHGVIVLADAETGVPLAIMDSMEITALRTAATTALAARCLARPDAVVATVVGCGVQGRYHLRALARTIRLEQVWLHDLAAERADALASEMAAEIGVPIAAVSDLRRAVRSSQVCVTCTPARAPVLGPADIPRGLFVGAIGADREDKQELEPEVLAAATVVVDHLEQCAAIGELHHAIAHGRMTKADVRAELWEIVAGRRTGRTSPDEVIVFDSSGTALQDVAAAVTVYERAAAGPGRLTADLGGRATHG
jgi:ornithine cyclodeaminase/alanine dehydrogenase-like protein (mu-crystallin family)